MSSFCIPRTVGLDGLDLGGRERELRHLELFLEVLDLLAVVAPGLAHLLGEPVGPRVRDAHEPEVEEVDRLVPPLGELDADRLGLLEAGDVVAGVAAVVGDDLLAHEEVLVPRRHLREVRLRVDDRAGLHEVLGDEGVALGRVGLRRVRGLELRLGRPRPEVRDEVRDLVVGQAQVRHPRLGVVGLRVLQPRGDPARRRLLGKADQVRAVLAPAVHDAPLRAGLGDVAALAADVLEEDLAPRRVALARGRGTRLCRISRTGRP